MDDTISAGDDHIHDQHEYPIDYADDDEDFGETLTYKFEDPLEHIQNHIDVNSNYHLGESSNHNQDAENENEFIDDEADDAIVDDSIDL
uniref:Uncharacterized protein n=1 Tax=Lactuca sativa TaxID=4236 RepID=A0A9R1UKL4_LACSA|nr:hypothetical protein LSAT_V11C900505140 [Lactuca sativa]